MYGGFGAYCQRGSTQTPITTCASTLTLTARDPSRQLSGRAKQNFCVSGRDLQSRPDHEKRGFYLRGELPSRSIKL